MPNTAIIEKLKCYEENGCEIVLYTARNMRRYGGDFGMITNKTLPTLKVCLCRLWVSYYKIVVGKSWGGKNGFYENDCAVKPQEFIDYSIEELLAKIKQ